MKKLVSAVVVGFLAVSMAMAAGADGKKVYTAKCQSCHSADGKGKPSMAKLLKLDPAALDLTKAATTKKPAADLAKDILKGVGKMKPVKVTPAEADAVVAYFVGLGAAKK